MDFNPSDGRFVSSQPPIGQCNAPAETRRFTNEHGTR
jgi:hypothetical protein